MQRAKAHEVVVGQRYCKAEAPGIVWEVTSVFKGTDRKSYARLVRVDDSSLRKTVSIAALGHGTQYLPIARRHRGS